MLRQIDSQVCKQFVSQNSPAIVITIVKLCFSPPFKYIAITHNDDSVIAASDPMSKDEIEFVYNIEL